MAAIPFIGRGGRRAAGSTGWRWPTRSPRATAARARAVGDLFLIRGADTLQARAAWVDGLGAAAKTFDRAARQPPRGLPSVQGALLALRRRQRRGSRR